MKITINKNTRGFAEIIFLLAIFIVGICVVVYFVLKDNFNNSVETVKPILLNIKSVLTPTPTPFAFQDLTIPYLRQRSYQSKISNMQKISENSTYTSYFATYDSDGLKINGLLTVPVGEKPQGGWPAVVFVHGYIVPEVYKTQINYVSWIDYLVKNGFVVFKIDLRGHDESEGEAGGAYYSSDYVIDTLNAYTALQNTDFVNPDAIGLWGHSMAGNVVFRSLAVKQDIPAVVIWAGAGYTYTDLQEYSIQDTSYRPPPSDSERTKKREELRDTYGSFNPDDWFWKQVPGTNYLEGITGAVGLIHAIDDDVVSINYSRNLISILDNTDISHEITEFISGGHNLTGSSFSSALRETTEFFRSNL